MRKFKNITLSILLIAVIAVGLSASFCAAVERSGYVYFDRGDILVYQTKNHIISHRIVDDTDNGFITKGDANKSLDGNLVKDEQVLGKGTDWCIPLLGYYADFIYNHKYYYKEI